MAHLRFAAKTALVACALVTIVSVNCLAHGDIDRRIEEATRRIEEQPADPTLYLLRSDLYREHRSWRAAESDIAAAERLDRMNSNLLYHRALLLRDKGEMSAAVDLLNRFVGSGFDESRSTVLRSRAHAELGRVLAELGQWRGAADQYSLAIVHTDGSGLQLYLSRAEALAKTGDSEWTDEALRGLDEGIERLGVGSILPDYAIDIEANRGDFDGALARIERRIQAPGYRLQALLKKAEVLEMAGRKEVALRAFADAKRALDALSVKVQSTYAVRRLAERVDAGSRRLGSALASEPAVGGGGDAIPSPS